MNYSEVTLQQVNAMVERLETCKGWCHTNLRVFPDCSGFLCYKENENSDEYFSLAFDDFEQLMGLLVI